MSKDAPIPVHGDGLTFNLDSKLRVAIMNSSYFQELMNMKSFDELAKEVSKNVHHVEPYL